MDTDWGSAADWCGQPVWEVFAVKARAAYRETSPSRAGGRRIYSPAGHIKDTSDAKRAADRMMKALELPFNGWERKFQPP